MPEDNPQPDVEAVESFLKGLGQQQASDVAFRNLGRSVGLYLLGVLDAGAEPAYALNLVTSLQTLIFNRS